MVLDRLPLALAAATVGWCAGWLSAWLSERIESHSEPQDAAKTRGVLVRDPLVQGGAALVWAATALLLPTSDWLHGAETGLLAVPLLQVAVTDFRTRYVYTVVAASGIVLGLAFGWQVHSTAMPWWTSLAGAAGGFAAFGLLYLLGRLLYRGQIEAMARGDITIAAMVGAISAGCTPQALFAGVLLGGLFAVVLLVARRSGKAFMPYGPGLCLGGLVTLFLC